MIPANADGKCEVKPKALVPIPFHVSNIYGLSSWTCEENNGHAAILASIIDVITKYRIAGNFRGSKLLRIHPKIIFTELFFANFIIQPFCTVLSIISRILVSQISKNHEKCESYWPRKFPAIRYNLINLLTTIVTPIA